MSIQISNVNKMLYCNTKRSNNVAFLWEIVTTIITIINYY